MTRTAPTTIYSGPNCNLPPLPQPLGPSGGVPEYDAAGKETGRVLLTRDWLVSLAVYAQATRDWIASAAKCLEAQR